MVLAPCQHFSIVTPLGFLVAPANKHQLTCPSRILGAQVLKEALQPPHSTAVPPPPLMFVSARFARAAREASRPFCFTARFASATVQRHVRRFQPLFAADCCCCWLADIRPAAKLRSSLILHLAS